MSQTATTRTGKPLHIGILGGGITGLTAAFYLLRAGHEVTLMEARPQLGGLASYFNFGSFWWDKFYHCILTSDASLLQLINDLDLAEELRWTETKVGFFSRGKLYSMTTTMEFLRFPVLSLWNKLRLGLGIIYTSRIKDGLALEQEPIEPWLVRIFGKTNYERMWGPLLKCKLGSASRETSASFIWATIRRLYSTREKNASKKERLGYVRGGYRTVCARLLERIEAMGGMVLTNFPVEQIRSVRRGRVLVSGACENLEFDRLISTLPSAPFAEITPELDRSYRNKLTRIQYMGMVCVVLVLRRKLTPYYCTNLIENLPFTGIIEMTNLISQEETNGRHLVYLPKYTSPDDPLFTAGDDEVWRSFSLAIEKVIPDLRDEDIEQRFIFRERLVQPIPVLNYSQLAPEMQTPVPNLLLANTTQIVNSTLNNNEMVKIARSAVDAVLNSAEAECEEYAPPALASAQRTTGLSTRI
ncbi:MAG TPA: NAD(P)/FAD-dependent oxidoreductase [Candidatus Angelobacter sp.]|nr:NAD(P)/FAD-dependent oxidoreductase [Candidatus Angelobacter sp.]